MELNFEGPVILVGDGPIHKEMLLSLSNVPIIAVDGGANVLARLGFGFEYLCGDLDSVDPSILEQIDPSKIIRLDDQNACDLEKTIAIINAPKIYGFGFLGGRMDHSIEALRLVSKNAEKSIELIDKHDRAFVWPSGASKEMNIGQRVSLMAFGHCQVRTSVGLKYPINGLEISPEFMSLSNEACANEVSISYKGAPLLALIDI